jgi:hypothetical protein
VDHPENPLEAYSHRLNVRKARSALQMRLFLRLGKARLLVFILSCVFAWFAFRNHSPIAWLLLLAAAAFAVLVAWSDHARREKRRLDRAAEHYRRGLSHLKNQWIGNGEQGVRFLDSSHPYAEDLDLFGQGSVFELICTARTRMGEDALASWLKSPAPPKIIHERQVAVEELRNRLDLREDIAVLGEDVRAGVNPDALAAWALGEPVLVGIKNRFLAILLATGTVIALSTWITLGAGRLWFFAMLLLEGMFFWRFREKVRMVLNAVERPFQDLKLFSQVLERLEREKFAAPLLARQREELNSTGLPPSRQIARLNFILALLDSRRNMLFAPIAFILLWDLHFAFALEAWRRKYGKGLPGWLAAVGEMEALCALAGYAFEHPGDPFAEIQDGTPCFIGEGLGHPLLPEDHCIRNDIHLDGDLRVLVVSGSNMSGKSTLLRTIGTNAVLALAGAPVRANQLRISPLSIGASIRVMDSLQAGSSRFYAEITRLSRMMDLAKGPQSLLFLLDELLHGTNSHDRRIGAEAIIKAFMDRHAIGLLTTHDLALSHIADVIAPRGKNVHFEDRLIDGKIVFDYRLHPGTVRHSNALELMRSVGIQID